MEKDQSFKLSYQTEMSRDLNILSYKLNFKNSDPFLNTGVLIIIQTMFDEGHLQNVIIWLCQEETIIGVEESSVIT